MRNPLETEIQNQICNYLVFRTDLYFWVCQTTGIYDPTRKAFRKKNPFAVKGASDIIVILTVNGLAYPVFLEVKRPKGKSVQKGYLKPEQKEFQANVEKHGALYYVVRSVEDVCIALSNAKDEIREKVKLCHAKL